MTNDELMSAVNRKLNCPKCGKVMVEGYVLDMKDQTMRGAASWVEGAPERSFWTGLKTRNRENIPIRTFRCSACGYLESYADSIN